MTGDEDGFLKLLVSRRDRTILGVHVIGTAATDLVHVGQAMMGGELPVDFVVRSVFNYPTFAEAYKVAALDAANQLAAVPTAMAGQLSLVDPRR
jgi:NAD(P) transhydrogenase